MICTQWWTVTHYVQWNANICTHTLGGSKHARQSNTVMDTFVSSMFWTVGGQFAHKAPGLPGTFRCETTLQTILLSYLVVNDEWKTINIKAQWYAESDYSNYKHAHSVVSMAIAPPLCSVSFWCKVTKFGRCMSWWRWFDLNQPLGVLCSNTLKSAPVAYGNWTGKLLMKHSNDQKTSEMQLLCNSIVIECTLMSLHVNRLIVNEYCYMISI